MRQKLLRFTGIGALLLFAQMGFLLRGLSPNIMALQLCFSPEAFRHVLEAWSLAGLDAYRRHFPYDFVFLVCYGCFGYLLATGPGVLAQVLSRYSRQARWILPIAAGFDFCENVAHLAMLSMNAVMTPAMVALSGTFSLLKWVLIIGFLFILGILLVTLRQTMLEKKLRPTVPKETHRHS
jgi:hypothetical protein